MRLLLAMLKHETNTFSPVPTDLARFEAWGLARGSQVARLEPSEIGRHGRERVRLVLQHGEQQAHGAPRFDPARVWTVGAAL